MRRPRGKQAPPFEAAALQPIIPEGEIYQSAQNRDEKDRPKPRKGGGGTLPEQEKMRDEGPGCEIANEQKNLHSFDETGGRPSPQPSCVSMKLKVESCERLRSLACAVVDRLLSALNFSP